MKAIGYSDIVSHVKVETLESLAEHGAYGGVLHNRDLGNLRIMQLVEVAGSEMDEVRVRPLTRSSERGVLRKLKKDQTSTSIFCTCPDQPTRATRLFMSR